MYGKILTHTHTQTLSQVDDKLAEDLCSSTESEQKIKNKRTHAQL